MFHWAAMFIDQKHDQRVHTVWREMSKLYEPFCSWEVFKEQLRYFESVKNGGVAFLALPGEEKTWVLNAYCPKNNLTFDQREKMLELCFLMGAEKIISNASCEYVESVLKKHGFKPLPGYKGKWYGRTNIK